jgi:hypothetical protein
MRKLSVYTIPGDVNSRLAELNLNAPILREAIQRVSRPGQVARQTILPITLQYLHGPIQ